MVLNIGDSAPDFELTDPDMKMRTLGEFKGKKIVLSFIVAASSPVSVSYTHLTLPTILLV